MKSRYSLSPAQIETLVKIVREQSGDTLSRADFNDAMSQLFENVPGFETLPAAQRRKYLQLLWLRYQIAGSRSRCG